jgi:hypothetical protein
LAELVLYGVSLGYEIAFDEVTERITVKDPTSDHMPNSTHHIGLGGDLLLYKGGVYQTETDQYKKLGEHWEQMGVARNLPLVWGGRFAKADGNHFSYKWEGRS